jgi:23S rRNA pseudouridine1911/1915/1917 synthase
MSDTAEPEERRFRVEPSQEGLRLDRFLSEQCPDLSRSQIQRALDEGRGRVAGRTRLKSHRLLAGQEVVFRPLRAPALQAMPEDLPLAIVYGDEDLVVIDKPAGLVVHPAPGHATGTLVNALLHHYGPLAAAGDPLRPGIVHRLDRDTSGLLVVALHETSHRALAAQLRARRMRRVYLALSWGCWPSAAGQLRGAIGRHPRRRQRMAVVSSGGRAAETHYQVEEDFGFVQLCRVSLTTGRTHQIRVHFAHHGHPIVGDPVYGDDRRARNVRPVERGEAARLVKLARRQLLHAAELTLVHPRSGLELTFRSPLPPDLAAALSLLRQAGSA